MKSNEATLIIPILAGRSEAWRRFLQELQGSRQPEFHDWRRRIGLSIHDIRLHDAWSGGLVMINLSMPTRPTARHSLVDAKAPFDRWLASQLKLLHGLDLTLLRLGDCPLFSDLGDSHCP